MLASSLETRYKLTLNQRRFFFISFVVSFVLNIALSMLLLTKDKQVILVPLQMESPISVSNSKMSPDYIKSLSLFFTEHLFNNLNKDSGGVKLSGIAPYLSSNAYENAKIHIEKQQKDLAKYDNSTKFEVVESEIMDEKAVIRGQIFYFRKNKLQINRDVIATFIFKNHMGRVLLDDFEVKLNEETEKEKQLRRKG